jgi:hypothetical protein
MQSIGRWERAESPLEPALDIVIRQIAAEKLQVKVPESIIELCMQVTPQASANQITIDHVDDPLCPYRPAAYNSKKQKPEDVATLRLYSHVDVWQA